MRRPVSLLAVLLCTSLAACGNGDQNRPAAIASFPAEGAIVNSFLGAFRIDYDQPVTILNEDDARVWADGASIRITTYRNLGEPNSIYIAPYGGGAFTPGAEYQVQARQGLAINVDEHYSLDLFEVTFTLGPGGPLAVGSAANAKVYLLDADTLTLSGTNDTVDTPGAEAPLGILTFEEITAQRAFVQLTGGDALATFELETDGSMTAVPLTAPGTLSTAMRAMAAGPAGAFFYCAFREGTGGGIRLYRVNPLTGMESAFLDLTAIPTGASTSPAGLGIEGQFLYVAAFDGATGTLAVVDLLTFTEVDLDDGLGGVQGLTLPSGAGPLAVVANYVVVADPTASTATRIDRETYAIQALSSVAGGTSIDCIRTRDLRGVIQPLAAFDLVPRRPYVRRNESGYTNANTLEISDLIGDTSAGTTAATAMAELPSYLRFLLVLDGQIATRLLWNGSSFSQQDADLVEDGVQALDLDITGPGVTGISTISTTVPVYPPAGP